MKTRGLRSLRRCRLLAGALLLAGFAGHAQPNQVVVAVATYYNRLFVPAPVLTNAQLKSVAFFSGNVGSETNVNTPRSGNMVLKVSSFGQPVATTPFVAPDFFLGQQIVPPPGAVLTNAPTFDNPNRAFFVAGANQIFASEAGFVKITWLLTNGTLLNRTYFISEAPGGTAPPQSMYWTDSASAGSGAPTIDFSGVNVIPHFNSSLPTGSVFVASNRLHARDNVGAMVLEYHEANSNSFLGVQVINVKSYSPDEISSVDVGIFLAPAAARTNQARPVVSRGLAENPVHFAYQHSAPGDAYDGKIFATQPTFSPGTGQLVETNLEVFWMQTGFANVRWPYEMHRYQANWPANFASIAQRIYWTHRPDDSTTRAPRVDIPDNIPNVTIHYNANIPPDQPINGVHSSVWQQSRALFSKQGFSGPLLLHYDNAGSPGFLGVEYVDVRPYQRDYVEDKFVGDRLLPTKPASDLVPPDPLVTRGSQQNDPQNPDYVYQHGVFGAMKGYLFAVRTNQIDGQVEVFWRQTGLQGVIWPYEMHWYRAAWPVNVPAKYQLYVRGTAPVLGPDVVFPPGLDATLMPSQEPAGNANSVFNARFSANGPGWSLIKCISSDLVDFQVVRSVLHDDSAFFDLSPVISQIGVEITDSYHQGPRPGFVYVPAVGTHSWDRYDWEIYDGKAGDPPEYLTRQIFAVNRNALEVWWSNLKVNVGQITQWPSLVKRYDNRWPSQTETIVIADRTGSGTIDPSQYSNARIYLQNDGARAGFNPNDEHAFIQDNTIYALRCDLGTNSEPFVLLRHQDPLSGNRWNYRIFKVVAEQAPYFFSYAITAPALIEPPAPLNRLPFQYCLESYPEPGPYWRSRETRDYAKQGGDDGGTTNLVVHFYYEMKEAFGFYFPDANLAGGGNSPTSHVAWLDRYAGTPGTPVRVTNIVSWPAAPTLNVGETLVGPKKFLPDIGQQNSVELVYQQAEALSQGDRQSVQLIDPTRIREAPLDAVPPDVKTIASGGLVFFPDLPPHLRSRLWFDPSALPKKLRFKGQYVVPPAGEYYVLLNVLTGRDRDAVLAVSKNPTPGFVSAVNALTNLPLIQVPPNTPFSKPLALTAGAAAGSGYVTLAFNNNTNLNDPISLEVIQVACPVYAGELKVIASDNPFDEKLSLRHSGDFAGKADRYVFDWRVEDPVNGLPPTKSPEQWGNYNPVPASGQGALDVTVGGAGTATLSDHYFVCRYHPVDNSNPCGTNWSAWTAPQLQEGWIKRVLDAINPFDQRNSDYANSQVDSIVSMIGQAGARSVGNVPLNQQAANNFGLIEIYETIFRRGLELNAAGTAAGGYPPVNDALLLVAGRLADLYMLLGNEAFADAADPTIAYGTDDHQYGAVATSIHCFMNQTSSLLEEELALLRGRDDTLLPPVTTYPTYNRLIWNFTHDINGGEHAYALNYDIHDVTGPNGVPDGVIDAFDAKRIYPQGHGDAWGHYLTAIKNYYDLLRNDHFTWAPRIEAVQVGGVPVSVDYLDERKFAQAAGAKARAGAEIVNLTYRSAYVEDPQGQWQGYLDARTNRAWGVAEWGSRAGQGAYFDWVVGNAILPQTYTPGFKLTQYTLDQVGNASTYFLSDAAVTNAIPRAATTISTNLLAQLLALPVRQFSSRSNFAANLDQAIGGANRQLYQGAIFSSAQTAGLPEPSYEVLDVLKGHIYPSLAALEAALASPDVLGPALFSLYYTNLIKPNLEVPTGDPVTGIQKIDRNSVTELREVASAFLTVQEQVDKADAGLNPLGLAKNAVPFDIDPTLVSQGKTHFEQIYDRAVQALNNAIVVFDHANDSTQLLRRQADTLADFQKNVSNQEADFTNRLIEIFGYPYPEDIGAGGTYPDGYEGPDVDAFHFNYVDTFDLTGLTAPPATSITQPFHTLAVNPDGSLVDVVKSVTVNLSTESLTLVKPANWTHRRAIGQIQKALGDLTQARLRFESALASYDNLIRQIEDQASLLQAQYEVNAAEINILDEGNATQATLNDQIAATRKRELDFRTKGRIAALTADALAEMLPLSAGFSFDATSTLRGAIKLAGSIRAELMNEDADNAALAELDFQQAKEEAQALTNLRLTTLHQGQAILQQLAQVEQLVRQEVLSRLDIYSQGQAMQQAAEAYGSVLAQGQRLLEDRLRFRQQTAAQIQSARYKDMAFRIFRNDALQKYRAQFDLAAAYVYLAARTYDYETNLRTNDNRGPGQKFMTDIIRSRSLGLVQSGLPVVGNGTGDAGLADPMARMISDWNLVLKGQLGFNNPETETGRFSLRSELSRVQTNGTTAAANAAWREILTRSVVTNLLAVPEFQRYCIPFVPSQPVEPAIVIPFSTTINFGQNFFGWPLGGGDNSYDSSHFTTKIRSVGVWFANYNNTTLANQPRVYLIPIGSDIMTSPPRFPGDAPFTREWKILDQELPVPFPLNDGDLSDSTYIPINDSLIGDFGGIRKYASFRAYHDSGNFNPAETITASRLIGRSVWNNRWLLIIPAGTLLSDRNEAIQRFINGRLVNGVRDGNGVSDIKIFFQTYSYSGN